MNPTPASLRQPAIWGPGLAVLAVLLALFHETAADMVHIWIRSETFQHAFLVPPIAAWLVWRKRDVLAGVQTRPVPWLLLPMVLTCLVWLLGHLADVAAAMQLALVTLIVMTVPALFGWRMARVLAFPLLFLYFMVPFGEFAVPYLQEWTADVTVLALRLTGIPVYREGMQFVIPSGSWSVVEACSGIRYLIACFMVGTLFAYLNYRSTRRRVVFVLAALIVPVFANWIRAYTIVMIGHVTGSPMILGVEHTTYGWFLFGAVVMVMFWAGTYWAEDTPSDSSGAAARRPALTAASRGVGPAGVAAAIAALLVATQGWAWALQPDERLPSPNVALPDSLADWHPADAADALEWTPGFVNPSATALAGYRHDAGTVHVWVGYYRQQSEHRKLVTSVHRIVNTEDRRWRSQSTAVRPGDSDLPAFATAIVSPGAAPTFAVPVRQRVWYLYWLEGRWLIRPAEIKLRQALARLQGHGDDGAIVMLVTPMTDDADAILGKFARQHLAGIETVLERTRESRTSTGH